MHKGKDVQPDDLNNWYCISLTNTDYKILARGVSRRLLNVMRGLVNEDQVGFIKNRKVSTVVRLNGDTMNYLNKTNLLGILLAVTSMSLKIPIATEN